MGSAAADWGTPPSSHLETAALSFEILTSFRTSESPLSALATNQRAAAVGTLKRAGDRAPEARGD